MALELWTRGLWLTVDSNHHKKKFKNQIQSTEKHRGKKQILMPQLKIWLGGYTDFRNRVITLIGI